MAASSESHRLTTEEQRALDAVQHRFTEAGLHGFSSYTAEQLWAKRAVELTAKRLQPYNDLLFKHMMSVIDFPGAISALMEKIKVAKDKRDLSVPIWEFNHCRLPDGYRQQVEYMPHIELVCAGNEDAKRAEVIHANGWRGLVGTTRVNEWYGDTEFHYNLQEIEYVFRKTDLKQRLALEFGGRYFSITIGRKWDTKTVDGEEYHIQKCQVLLEYFPYGLPAYKLKDLGAVALKYTTHVSEVPSTDLLVLEDGTQALKRREEIYGTEALETRGFPYAVPEGI